MWFNGSDTVAKSDIFLRAKLMNEASVTLILVKVHFKQKVANRAKIN